MRSRARLAAVLGLSTLLGLATACGGSGSDGEGPAAEAPAGREIAVMIDGTGYTPDQVTARAGEALTLVFERLDANNCGGEVVFPDTGKKVEIPVGKKVAVNVTAPDDGQLAFTCGMAMYEGAVVVQ